MKVKIDELCLDRIVSKSDELVLSARAVSDALVHLHENASAEYAMCIAAAASALSDGNKMLSHARCVKARVDSKAEQSERSPKQSGNDERASTVANDKTRALSVESQRLNGIVVRLECIVSEIKTLRDGLCSAQGEYQAKLCADISAARSCCVDYASFAVAVSRSVQAAKTVLYRSVRCEASGYVPQSAFAVRERSAHIASAASFSEGNYIEPHNTESVVDVCKPDAPGNSFVEITVNDRSKKDVLRKIDGVPENVVDVRIRIPAASIGFIGGKAFFDELSARGFFVVPQNGSIIRTDGYVVLERRHEA